MKTNVPGRIADSLVHVGAVPSEDKALYEYGVRQGILMVINFVTAVLIGLILGMVWQTIVFLIAYIPVRSYAGGYHAGTNLTCYLLSVPLVLTVLLGIKLVPWNGYLCLITLFCAAVIIEILAPVEDSNKPLNEREKVVYKKRARGFTAFLFGVAIALWFTGIKQSSLSIVMALGVAAVMLILGAAKNRIRIKEEKA